MALAKEENVSSEEDRNLEVMENEARRLETFHQFGWPEWVPVTSEKLAKAGFFYTGNGDEVQCFCCAGRCSGAKYPNCPFVLNPLESGNIPLTQSSRCVAPVRVPIPPDSSDLSPSVPGRSGARPTSLVFRTADRLSRSMKREEDRLETFRRWPRSSIVQPSQLAKAGFFYTGKTDTVQCAFCHGRLQEWRAGDDPLQEHRSHFGDCPFVRSQLISERPAAGSSRSNIVDAAATATRGSEETAEDGATPSAVELVLPSAGERGFLDNVKCFHCNGGLHNWDPSDSPFREHAKWFESCDYLRLCKGDEYIEAVRSGRLEEDEKSSSTSLQNRPQTLCHLMELGVDVSNEQIFLARDMGYSQELIVAALTENSYRLFNSVGELIDKIETLRQTGAVTSSGETQNETVVDDDSSLPTKPGLFGKGSSLKSHIDSNSADSAVSSLTLEIENRFLKEQRTCKICMDAEISVVILPCGHLCCCPTCAPALKYCPICRKEIRGFVRTYFS